MRSQINTELITEDFIDRFFRVDCKTVAFSCKEILPWLMKIASSKTCSISTNQVMKSRLKRVWTSVLNDGGPQKYNRAAGSSPTDWLIRTYKSASRLITKSIALFPYSLLKGCSIDLFSKCKSLSNW